jgi:hypothetical protein
VRFLRVVWIAVAALTAGVFVWGMPSEFARLRTACDDDLSCAWLPRLTVENTGQLRELGLSTYFFASYFVVIEMAFTITSFAIGAMILWRRPDDRMALVVSLMLLTLGAAFFVPYPLLDLSPVWTLLAQTVSFVGSTLLILFLYIFPDGRFVPGWTRWPAAVWIAGFIPANYFYDSALFVFDYQRVNTLLTMGFVGITVYAQVYRYHRVSNPAQRLQTKWVVFGIVVALGGVCALVVLDLLVPSGVMASLFGSTTLFFFAFLIPLSIGVAVLRYRLFDIDILINRTLVYGSLTATLAVVYFGGVAVTQTLFRLLTGQQQQPQLAVVASTLAIAALFGPLRRRIQNLIDRRFYRRKYDAQRTLAIFSKALREETDLNVLGQHLTSVVRNTVQPEHVSLWLKPTGDLLAGDRGDSRPRGVTPPNRVAP